MSYMNYSTAVFLINKAVRAVKVSYERDPANPEKCAGNLTMFKTIDTMKPGDFVVVPTDTRWQMTVCRVEFVDVEVDLESTVQVGWIIGNVDRAAYEEILRQETNAIATIKSAEKRKKQEELVAALMKDNPELKELSGVGMGVSLPAPEAPKP